MVSSQSPEPPWAVHVKLVRPVVTRSLALHRILCHIRVGYAGLELIFNRGGAGQVSAVIQLFLSPAFFCRYGNVPFTKNPEKYIKYQVDQVGEMIEKLFDTSA